ncbi:MAG TPA: hypothetical protein VF557_09025 [Jatrophihabitans sp.]|jgi:hypothetical protein|uniref:hypothetical protein n=1 Tax=Jatrophihabitans sp. TaxID=1932789 RepID=UPI002EF509C3
MGTREWATLFWLAVLLVFCLTHSELRQSLGNILKQLGNSKLLVPLLTYMVIIAGLTWVVDRLGYWDPSLIGAVGFWFFFTGFGLFIQSMDAIQKPGFFRKRIVELIGAGAFFEFFLNIRTFSIPVEIVLQLGLAVLVMLQVVSASKDEFKPVHRAINVVLLGVLLWLVVATALYLASHWHELNPHDVVASFLVPVWLTVAALPYLYLVALVGTYESVFLRMRSQVDTPASWAAKLGVIVQLRGHPRRLSEFRGMWPRRAGEAASFRGAQQVVRDYEADRDQQAADEVA